jgi:hypothetical protein
MKAFQPLSFNTVPEAETYLSRGKEERNPRINYDFSILAERVVKDLGFGICIKDQSFGTLIAEFNPMHSLPQLAGARMLLIHPFSPAKRH